MDDALRTLRDMAEEARLGISAEFHDWFRTTFPEEVSDSCLPVSDPGYPGFYPLTEDLATDFDYREVAKQLIRDWLEEVV